MKHAKKIQKLNELAKKVHKDSHVYVTRNQDFITPYLRIDGQRYISVDLPNDRAGLAAAKKWIKCHLLQKLETQNAI